MKIDFYTTNPFKENLEFRINDFKNNKLSIHEQFVKNLIAYAYFEVKKPIYGYEDEYINRFSQEELLDMYLSLELYFYEKEEGDELFSTKSLISIFWEYEICCFLEDRYDEKFKDYFFTLLDYNSIIEKIDAVIEMKTPLDKDSIILKNYFLDQRIKIELLQIDVISFSFYYIFSNIYSNMCATALEKFAFEGVSFTQEVMNENFNKLRYYLNPKLFSDEELKQLHNTSAKWFEQSLSDIIFFLGLDINTNVFDELRKQFYAILNLTTPLPPNTTSISAEKVQLKVQLNNDYPIHVFKNSEAYHFFDSCAQRISSTKMLSLLYRKMFEIDNLIYLRDTEFRNWFNQQNYPLNLDYPTDTFSRVASKERLEWMAIVEHFYKLNE